MNARSILFLGVVAAAVLIPYRATREPRHTGTGNGNWWNSLWTQDDGGGLYPPIATASPYPSSAGWTDPVAPRWDASAQNLGGPITPQGPRFQSLAEIVRFDITPPWVMQQWPQVGTRSSDGDLSGLRVTLVSGTRPTDLAGALTYYFDPQQRLQRIGFQGFTGDPSELVALAQQFGLRPVATSAGTSFESRNAEQRVVSGLWIQHSPIVSQHQPLRRHAVDMELALPGSQRPVSELFAQHFSAPNGVTRQIPNGSSGNGTSGYAPPNGILESTPPAGAGWSPNAGPTGKTDPNRPRRPNTDRLVPRSR